jgi:hypothetical protein
MQPWQLGIMGGVLRADDRECKQVSGIDDYCQSVVISAVVTEPSARAICQAFTSAMTRHEAPSKVLADNGKQFTGGFIKGVSRRGLVGTDLPAELNPPRNGGASIPTRTVQTVEN